MNTLVYSEKCKHCQELLGFIEDNPDLKQVTRFHDINRSGVPRGVNRVPTLVKHDGSALVGADVKEYFESVIVPTTEGFENDGMFSIESYGSSLAPKMTKDLEDRINANVKDSFKSYEPVNIK